MDIYVAVLIPESVEKRIITIQFGDQEIDVGQI